MTLGHREFKVGDSVIVLNHIKHNTLQVHWLGPGVMEHKLGRTFPPNKPGCTSVVEHNINTGDTPPIRSAPYRAVGEHAQQMEAELQEMLELGVIQPSKSVWASPIVLVPKNAVW